MRILVLLFRIQRKKTGKVGSRVMSSKFNLIFSCKDRENVHLTLAKGLK